MKSSPGSYWIIETLALRVKLNLFSWLYYALVLGKGKGGIYLTLENITASQVHLEFSIKITEPRAWSPMILSLYYTVVLKTRMF
jgi:hypothetical protein